MEINERILSRRVELNLSDIDVALLSDLTYDEYQDIEFHSDEIITLTDIYNVKKYVMF